LSYKELHTRRLVRVTYATTSAAERATSVNNDNNQCYLTGQRHTQTHTLIATMYTNS
jgi:hypothetical protein